MEKIIILLIASVPSLIQILGYYFSIRFKSDKIRWLVFILSMTIYYVLIYSMYLSTAREMDSHHRCGMWVITYYILGIFGLSMPITQIVISVYNSKRFSE